MACLQLLKPTPSNSQSKLGCFCAEFSLQKRRIRLRNLGVENNYWRFRVSCKAEDGDKQSNGEEPPESLFMKELRRRGMTPTSLLEEKNRSERDEEIKFKEEDGGWSYSRRNGITTGAETNLTDQREKSMALNSEGLEVFPFRHLAYVLHVAFRPNDSMKLRRYFYILWGLIPRAKLLLTLGGTFFLAFWPLILVTVAFTAALYLYFGTEFIHDGSITRVAPPPYIDPYELLEEERIYKAAPPLN